MRDAGGGPAISVVVPTRGRTTRLFLTLSALVRQSLPRDRIEIVVVDDGPDGRTAAAVARSVPGLVPGAVVRTGGVGVASVRNAGVGAAAAEIVLFLDDDTLATEDLLAPHLAAHAPGARVVHHGTVVDLTAFMFAPDPAGPDPASFATELVGVRGRVLRPGDLARLAEAARRLGPRRSAIESLAAGAAGGPLQWLLCIGTNTSLSRSAFDSVGGFDTRYDGLWGGEDLELGLRLARAGYRFETIPATAYHLATARHGTDEAIAAFWSRAAAHHDDPSLIHVGELLSGRETLARTEAVCAGAAVPSTRP